MERERAAHIALEVVDLEKDLTRKDLSAKQQQCARASLAERKAQLHLIELDQRIHSAAPGDEMAALVNAREEHSKVVQKAAREEERQQTSESKIKESQRK